MGMLGKIKSGRIERPQKVVLYGVEKVGKSSVIAGAGRGTVLFLDTEKGSSQLDVDRIEIDNWRELSAAVKELIREKHDFKIVAVDTIDWAEKLATDSLLEEEGQDSIEKVRDGFGKGWTMLAEKMQRFLDALSVLTERGVSVVLIAHSHVKRFDAPEGMTGYDRHQMKLSKKVEPLVKEWADSILFVNFKTRIVETKTGAKRGVGSDRVIYTERCAAYDAGCRVEGVSKEIILPGREDAKALFESVKPVFMLNGSKSPQNGRKAAPAVFTPEIVRNEPEPPNGGQETAPVENPNPEDEVITEEIQSPAEIEEEPEATADPNPDDPEDFKEFFEPEEDNRPEIMKALKGEAKDILAEDVLGFVRFRKIVNPDQLLSDIPEGFVQRVKNNPAGFATAVETWKKGAAAA